MAVGRSYVRNPDIVPLRPAYLPRYPLPSCSSLPSSLLSLIPAEHYWVKPYFDCIRQCRCQLPLVRAIKTKLRQCAQRNYARPDGPTVAR